MRRVCRELILLSRAAAERARAIARPHLALRLFVWLLALCGKVAALYVQDFDDGPSVAAVNEIEDLTTSLSEKIWQKIGILDRRLGAAAGVTGPD